MRTLMKCVDNGHFKQYEVSTKPLPGGTTELRTSYGRIGGNQTVNTAVLVDDKAYAEFNRLVSSKTKKGYVIVEEEEPNGTVTYHDDPTATTGAKARNYYKVPATVDNGAELESLLDDVLAGLEL